MAFAHLQVRSGYSLLNSTITIEKLVKRAKELEHEALALTDEAVLHGAIQFYKECTKHGIKPILGMIINVDIDETSIPLLLLAKTDKGYKSLIDISTHIQMENVCTLDFLMNAAVDTIGILSSGSPKLKQMLIDKRFDELSDFLKRFEMAIGNENLFLGLEALGQESAILLENAKEFYPLCNEKIVALHDVRYLHEKDELSYDCLQAMKYNEKWDYVSADRTFQNRHLKSKREMEAAFSDFPEIVENTAKIAQICNVTFDFNQQLLPSYPVPTGESAHVYLRKRCIERMSIKYSEVTEKVKERVEYELDIIGQLKFSDYFLIVADFVQFAKDNNIMVGTGRGSAAGSIVAYLLGITNVDPREYDLLFERFLDPERISMPDIDIDFSDVRRDEVFEYVREKY